MSQKAADRESSEHAKPMSKKTYKDSLRRLQVELVKQSRRSAPNPEQ